MAVTTDIWRIFNSVLNDCSSWMDTIKGASLRLLFPGIDVRHVSIDVGTTSTVVLGERGGCRRFLLLDNISDVDMYVKLDGTAAVINEGIRIGAGGNILLDITTTGQAVFAIHAGVGINRLLVTEDVQ